MLFDAAILPSQAMIPLGVALAHLALALYLLFLSGQHHETVARLFMGYLATATLWNFDLVAVVAGWPMPLPGTSWSQFVPYGMLLLGLIYWTFARAFLQQNWRWWGGWAIGLGGALLALTLQLGWATPPAAWLAWSNGWLTAGSLWWGLAAGWGGLFMVLTFLTAEFQQFNTRNPAHKNRIQYLLIATLLLFGGYGLYLTGVAPYWTGGLIITWLGSVLTIYIITMEELVDLSTAARRLIRNFIVVLIAVSVYLAGIYLVQIFLGDFLAATFLTRWLDSTLLVAVVTAVLLTIVYLPIRRLSEQVINRVLFGRRYEDRVVIQNYTQAISNILDLNQLSSVALNQIKQTLKLEHGALFLLDAETDNVVHFITLPAPLTNHFPAAIQLSRQSSIFQRLIEEGEPLSQYSLDISAQFRSVPATDLETLKSLELEWFLPILKKDELLGFFGLGSKITQQPYTPQDLHLLVTLADQTALALENAKLLDRVQRNLAETRRIKNLMDSVFDSMQNGVITIDVEGQITFFNKATESILALSNNHYVGNSFQKAMPMLANTIFSNLINNVIKQEIRYNDYEIISELPQRGRIDLSMNLAPLKDAQNQTQGVTIVMDDITETKRLQAVQDMFRRYVSPTVVDRLPADPSELELGGHRQELTILFADIRGFTSFSEKLAPEALVDTLNEYLSMAASAVLMYEGTLDKFMGDAVMGIFNAPLEQEDHVLRAVRAAAAMQRTIAEFHRNIGQARRLNFGVGLHVGEAVVGNVGMSDRMDYTAIGSTVNLAKRIQENTPGGKILMSKAVYDVVKNSVEAVFFERMKVKGREEPVNTYELRFETRSR